VRKFSAYMIRRRGAFVPFDIIRSHLVHFGDWARLLSLAEMNKWDWLETLAFASSEAESLGLDVERLRQSLEKWRRTAGHRFEAPSAIQLAYLRSTSAQLALCKLAGDDTMPIPFLELELRGAKKLP